MCGRRTARPALGTRLAEPGIGPLSVGFVTVTTTIVCWVTGDGARRLRELTRQLRREQEGKARRAVMDERIQIARELHDVIAHHVSVISVQTGLAGLSNSDIAERLVLSAATVKTHVHRCMSKLGVSGRAQAVVLAHESGLVARLP